jgi:hypothetical protein
MALITKWQKGFRNHPFRHLRFLGNPGIQGSKEGGNWSTVSESVSNAARGEKFFATPAQFGTTPKLLFNGFQFVSVK